MGRGKDISPIGLLAIRFHQLQLITQRKLLGCWMNSEDAIKPVMSWLREYALKSRTTPYSRLLSL